MKKILFILLIINALQVNAQTNVVQVGKGEIPQNSIFYYLPQTEIVIEVSVKKVVKKNGMFANYAKRLLALNSVITSKSEDYELEKVSISYNIVPDTVKNFAVEINAKTTAYNLHLNSKKIIKGVNLSVLPSLENRTDLPIQEKADTAIIFDYSVLSEDVLIATSEAKMAEIVAKQIFKIRESRMEILSGDSEREIDSENLPLIISELDRTERELIAFFEGKSKTFTETKTFRFVPKSAVENEIIFRFSPLLGIVEKDDLAGRAITFSVLPQNSNSDNLNETGKKIKKFGIYYNVPSSAQIAIFDGNRQLAEANFLFPQFGTLKFLPSDLFNNKNTQVIFSEFGGIELIK